MRLTPSSDGFLSTERVRSVDAWAAQTLGIPGTLLMENAGRSVAEILAGLVEDIPARPVLIVCGPGNNGGDGLVIARHLQGAGWPVRVVLDRELDAYKGDALFHAQILGRCGIPWQLASSFFQEFQDSAEGWRSFSWVVDALFGTGLTRPLAMPHIVWIEAINRSGLPVLAVDLPSGLDGDTGRPLGVAIRATHTVAMVANRPGLTLPEAIPFVGTVHVGGIGLPAWKMTTQGPTLAEAL